MATHAKAVVICGPLSPSIGHKKALHQTSYTQKPLKSRDFEFYFIVPVHIDNKGIHILISDCIFCSVAMLKLFHKGPRVAGAAAQQTRYYL